MVKIPALNGGDGIRPPRVCELMYVEEGAQLFLPERVTLLSGDVVTWQRVSYRKYVLAFTLSALNRWS